MENKDLEIFDEKVDRYLRNQMTAKEEIEFKKLLASDAELRSRAKTTALMIRQMEIVGKEKDDKILHALKIMIKEEFLILVAKLSAQAKKSDKDKTQDSQSEQGAKSSGKAKPVIPLWPKVIKYFAAACLVGVLFLGGYNYYLSNKATDLGKYVFYHQNLYSPFGSVTIDEEEGGYRGGDEDAKIRQRLRRYMVGAIESPNKEDRKRIISNLESMYEESLDPNSDYADYKDDIAWRLAIVYLLDGNRKKPIPILQGIVDRNKSYPDLIKPVQELISQIQAL